MVGGIEVSDDGTSVAAIYTTSAFYSYNNRERLRSWTGIDLDSSGDLVGTPVPQDLETSGEAGA